MSDHFLSLAKKRRTIYALGKDIQVPEAEIISTIKDAVKQAPSAFNSQSSRVVTASALGDVYHAGILFLNRAGFWGRSKGKKIEATEAKK